MNKTAIKNYAIWARVQLIENAKQRAYEYEITEKGENRTDIDTVSGRLLTPTEKKQRTQLIEQIHQKGYTQVMEEAAYTWFNRFIALRFMEVNGYLPSKLRVFTDENGAFKPDILKEALTVELEGLDRNRVVTYLEQQQNEELYKYLLITQCNALNSMLPVMFEKIDNWTELLFPANLLKEDSVIGQMVTSIPEEDWQDAVQIIGWMYQYYNSELKDETFALLKKNVKITKERIPAATQLFTPDWIVRYMVENSLGRLWYEGHQDFDKSEWKYYLDEAEQEPQVEEKLAEIRKEYAKLKPENIKVIDPCMGSGHILVYAFDVLMQIYLSAGWSERDAAKSILENNLYGLDIDDRAGQLAYFAVMMKARKYSRRILTSDVKPNVLSIQDSSFMTDDFIAYAAGKDTNIKADLTLLRKALKDAKEYGSILDVPALNWDALYERLDIINRSYVDLADVPYQKDCAEKLLPLIRQAQTMAQNYDVVVTNPPYMGSSGMSAKLSDYVKSNYPDTKSDMSTVCMEKALKMCTPNGYMTMINIPVWMFLSSYEKLRENLINNNTFINMVHPGRGIFGSDFGTTIFVIAKNQITNYIGTYARLFKEQVEVKSNEIREQQFLSGNNRYTARKENFAKIPGAPIAYWVSDNFIKAFQVGKIIGGFSVVSEGIKTGDNDKYLRLWHEVDALKFSFAKSKNGFKWYPHHKGGEYRKWYGNLDYVINWENNGYEIKCATNSGLQGKNMYFGEFASWSKISSKGNPLRYYRENVLFDSGAPALYNDELKNCLGLFNTVVGKYYLQVLSPTLNLQVGDVKSVPLLKDENVAKLVDRCIELSTKDWNAFETSWDFLRHPLV